MSSRTSLGPCGRRRRPRGSPRRSARGTCPGPAARGRCPGARSARWRLPTSSSPSNATAPLVSIIWHSARSVVVLPAPLAPSSTTTSPVVDREVERRAGPATGPYAGLHAGRETLEAATPLMRCSRGRPRSRSGRSDTSAGVPSAILRPKSSTTTLSEMPITMCMWCSTSSTVSWCRSRELSGSSSASSSTSAWVRPLAGSSSSSSAGSRPCARAISMRLSVP